SARSLRSATGARRRRPRAIRSTPSAQAVVVRGVRAKVRDRVDLALPRDEDVCAVAIVPDEDRVPAAAGADLSALALGRLLRRHARTRAALRLPAARLRPEV